MYMWTSIILLFGFLFYASYYIGSGVYLKAKCKLNDQNDSVALTFDDGVDILQTPMVLDVLKKYDVKATFFLIGSKAEQHPDIVERIIAEGHKIGIHSYSHKPIFPILSYPNMLEEVKKTKEILERISKTPITLFRPPFGVTNPNVANVVKELNLETIGWSIRSFDTNANVSRIEIAENVIRKIKGGDIILLHDDRTLSHILTEELLIKIKEKGYKIVLA